MSEVVRLSAAQVRPLRTGAPSAHVLDEADEAVHLGLLDDGELIGALSALPESPHRLVRGLALELYGPFGAGGAELVEAMVGRVGHGYTLWADSARPGLVADADGTWTRWTGEIQPAAGTYTCHDIQVLSGQEAIRKRPGMYLGSTGPTAVRHLMWELVANSIDQHLAGHATRLDVWSDAAGVGVSDDGVGLPPEAIARVCTSMHAGPTADGHHPHVHAALFGVGVVVVCVLSSVLVVTVDRDGRRWQQAFQRGRPCGDVRDLGPSTRTGTAVWFSPDPAIFPDTAVDLATARERFVELAHLNPRLRITVGGETLDGGEGLVSLAERLAGSGITRRLVARGVHDGVGVEVAVVWGAGDALSRGWANQIPARGSHVQGLADALASTPAEHRVALVAVDLQQPTFTGQAREKLEVAAAREAVARVVRGQLGSP